ncbi:MAG: hypothetical protein JRF27_01460 [Deltaproteobacteria bacterium]|nr:hypothetical protein [Deltaproteobacteria bacterium]MBW2192434.1 hypothetical protein [Deltaproteobacteria bacterium]
MFKIVKPCTVFFLIATLILVPFGATAIAKDKAAHQNIKPEAMIADLVFVRPLGIVAFGAGVALWIVSLPFTLTGGNSAQAAETLVNEPFRYTFARPLGDI